MLCVLYEAVGTPHVLLTRRSQQMRHHPHEVSFPGGRRDARDHDLLATARREAQEEIALDPDSVTPVGELDRIVTVGMRTLIYPYVATSDGPPNVGIASPGEVEAVLAVNLHELLLDSAWREEIWGFAEGVERALTFFEVAGDTIWGATAAILRQLLALATGTEACIERDFD